MGYDFSIQYLHQFRGGGGGRILPRGEGRVPPLPPPPLNEALVAARGVVAVWSAVAARGVVAVRGVVVVRVWL